MTQRREQRTDTDTQFPDRTRKSRNLLPRGKLDKHWMYTLGQAHNHHKPQIKFQALVRG